MLRAFVLALLCKLAVADPAMECMKALELLDGQNDAELAARCRAAYGPEVCRRARQALGPQPWAHARMTSSCAHFASAYGGMDARTLEQTVASKGLPERDLTGSVDATLQGKTEAAPAPVPTAPPPPSGPVATLLEKLHEEASVQSSAVVEADAKDVGDEEVGKGDVGLRDRVLHGEEHQTGGDSAAVVVTSAPVGADAKDKGDEEVGSQHTERNEEHQASGDSAVVVKTRTDIGVDAKDQDDEIGTGGVGSQHTELNGEEQQAIGDSAEVAETSTEIGGADELNGNEQQASSDSDLVAETGNAHLREMRRVENEGLVADVANRDHKRADRKAEEKQGVPDQEAPEQEVHDRMPQKQEVQEEMPQKQAVQDRMPQKQDRMPQNQDESGNDAGVRLYDGNIQVEKPEGSGSVSPILLTLLTAALLGTLPIAFIRSRGTAHSHIPLALEEDML